MPQCQRPPASARNPAAPRPPLPPPPQPGHAPCTGHTGRVQGPACLSALLHAHPLLPQTTTHRAGPCRPPVITACPHVPAPVPVPVPAPATPPPCAARTARVGGSGGDVEEPALAQPGLRPA